MSHRKQESVRPLDKLLPRLDSARKTGPDRWLACCPAHEDERPSLAIQDTPDGVLLLHCFAGCEIESIVGSAGLRMADLFPASGPDCFVSSSARAHRLSAGEALALIDHDALLVSVATNDILHRRSIDQETWDALTDAARRIGRARLATKGIWT